MNTAQKTVVVRQKFRRQLIIKVAVGILIGLAGVYLIISAYAGHTLSTAERYFRPEEAAVFAIIPEEVRFPATDSPTRCNAPPTSAEAAPDPS